MANLELENFRRTLAQLERFLQDPILNDRDRAGIIQSFEFTFEQSWKAIQKVGGRMGSPVGNPKQAYTLAIQSGWIQRVDEDRWIRLLGDRNLTSHTYKEDLAKAVLKSIQTEYVTMFQGLLAALTSA